MTEEIKNPSKLDTEGVKQERIKVDIKKLIIHPSRFVKKQPTKGSHIRVKRAWGAYYHHGIYISDSEVIHLTGKFAPWNWKNAKPECTSLHTFLDGGTVEVRDYTEEQKQQKQDVETIVENARKLQKKGTKGYNLLWNNCECFANSCVFFKDLEDTIKTINMTKLGHDGLVKLAVVTVLTLGPIIIKVLDSKNSDDSKEA